MSDLDILWRIGSILSFGISLGLYEHEDDEKDNPLTFILYMLFMWWVSWAGVIGIIVYEYKQHLKKNNI